MLKKDILRMNFCNLIIATRVISFAYKISILDKNAFRVYWSSQAEEDDSSSHTLVAPDEHTKRQWVSTITKTIDQLDR